MARRATLFLIALLIALLGTGAVFAYVNKADARASAGQELAPVLVAAKDIPAGTPADSLQSKGFVRTAQLPTKSIPDGALRDLGEVKNRTTGSQIVAGEMLLKSRFVDGSVASVNSPLPIPGNEMAVSISLEDPMRVGGYLKPGVEVAVFDTFNSYEGSRPGPKTPSGDDAPDNSVTKKFEYNRSTRVVLPRITVLAVAGSGLGGANSKTTTNSTTTSPGQDTHLTVTLAVTQAQAEKLIQVAQAGHPYLALLTNRSTTAPSDGVDDRNLFG
jgi:pilus assembly protein CpaB